jgi:hypothetical protein
MASASRNVITRRSDWMADMSPYYTATGAPAQAPETCVGWAGPCASLAPGAP